MREMAEEYGANAVEELEELAERSISIPLTKKGIVEKEEILDIRKNLGSFLFIGEDVFKKISYNIITNRRHK